MVAPPARPPAPKLVAADMTELHTDLVGQLFGPATQLVYAPDGRSLTFRTGKGKAAR